MGVERNLMTNPAQAVDATGWLSTPSGNFARSTTLHASLPRQTGFAGEPTTDVNTGRAAVVPGQQYVFSFSMRAITDIDNTDCLVNFYTSTSGGSFLSGTGTLATPLQAGTTQRFVLGPFTAPSNAGGAHIKINDIDGDAQITAVRCAPYTGDTGIDGQYFDGATTGAMWDGTAGASTSSRYVFRDSAVATDAFSFTDAPDPNAPRSPDAAVATDAFSIAGTGTLPDQAFAADGFLIGSLQYDEVRGRVRLEAFTFDPTVITVRVSRRVLGGKYELVRGGEVAALGGYMARLVDDYEYPAGVDVQYVIEGITENGTVLQRSVLFRSGAGDKAWLKFVANPSLNRRIDITGWGTISRRSRSATYDVQGRSTPVVVTDVMSSREVPVQFVCHNQDETDALDDALSQGFPIFLQVPRSIQLPSMYATVGDYGFAPPGNNLRSLRSVFAVNLTEVDPPPPSIAEAAITYADVLAAYGTYQALLDDNDNYREVVI